MAHDAAMVMEKALAVEKERADQAEKDANFFQGLIERAREDGARTEAERLGMMLKMEQTRVETVEATVAAKRAAMERCENELVLLWSQVEAFRELAVQTNSLA